MTDTDHYVEGLVAALAEAREHLVDASRVSGRPPAEIVVAGKYVPAREAGLLTRAGVAVIGENRLQDLQAKREALGDAVTFDFIGHLQRRKVRDVLGIVRLIHSVDSRELVEEIARRSEGTVRVLVEVNLANEPTKHGITASDFPSFMDDVSRWPNVVVGGLMTMPPMSASPEANRTYFSGLRELGETLAKRWQGRHDVADLSMGTSQDYVVAAEEGATLVRLGRGLFQRAKG